MVTLTCECCGHAQDYTDNEEAFYQGWDCPPAFSGPITCPFCPTSHLLLGITHDDVHEKWLREGGHPLLKQTKEQPNCVYAPWSVELVDQLNKYQRSGQFHPYTCGNNSEHILMATIQGWVCYQCRKQGQEYTQNWCLALPPPIDI